MKSLKISDPAYIKPVLIKAGNALTELLKAGTVEIRLVKESKTRDQEAKYHSMISDIARQKKVDGQLLSIDDWKALLVDGFENEKISTGETLRHPGRCIISLDGRRAITVRASTAKFIKLEGSEFIEYLYMKGSEYEVKFSDKSLEYYEETLRG